MLKKILATDKNGGEFPNIKSLLKIFDVSLCNSRLYDLLNIKTKISQFFKKR